METNNVTCHWLTPTNLMPDPYRMEAGVRPWSCLRDGCPRPMDAAELADCPMCPHFMARSFESVKRDLIFETWGVGNVVAKPRTLDEVKRHLMLETWGVD
jgi:hypothetical protein